MGLERIGHELVVKGAEQFNRKMRGAQKSTEDFQKTLAQGARSKVDLVPKGTASRLDKLRGMVGNFTAGLARLPGPLGQVGASLSRLTDLVNVSTIKWIALGAAAAAVTGVMLQLGARGAAVAGVTESFYAITQAADLTSQTLLGQLREASAGTIRDFELMRLTNLALAGATGELANEIGSKLPQLLEVARVQAKATGQSVDFLFNSLVTGVKRGSPLLIDNTGLVLNITAANEAMADSLGKTVAQLTENDKKMAVLNATLASGQTAIELYGNQTKTAAEYAAGFGVRIQNLLDRLGVAILPLYTLLLQVGDALLETLIWPLENLLIPALYALNAAILGPLSQAFLQFKNLMTTALTPLAVWLQAWLPPIIASFRLLGQVLAWLLAVAGKVFAGMAKQVRKFLAIFFGALDPQKFFEGGARTMGALARGMLWAANNLILPAVLAIATLIADFLVGLSPPKKGPLSMIDQGGENVMLAWLDGFMGVSLEPVEAMAAQVNEALGEIGNFSEQQIEARLLALDTALQPFIDNLELAKARFEAIVTPLEQILGIVDRRLDKALAGFFKGEISEGVVRALDQQREAVQAHMDAAQGMTDQAATQLALAQSRQAVERALLEIQRRRLTATEEEDAVLAQAAEKLKSGASLADVLGGGLGDLGGLGLTDPLADFLGIDEDAIQASMSGITDAFLAGFGSEGLAALDTFKSRSAAVTAQLERIKGSSGARKIANTFNDVFGPGGIISQVKGFVGEVTGLINTDLNGVFDGFSLDTIKATFIGAFGIPAGVAWANVLQTYHAIRNLFDRSFPNIFDQFSLDELKTKFTAAFSVEEEGVLWSVLNGWYTVVNEMFTLALPGVFTDFSLLGLIETFQLAFEWPDTGLRSILEGFLGFVGDIFNAGGRFAQIFDSLYGIISAVALGPMARGMNLFITIIEGTFNIIIDKVNELLDSWFVGAAASLGIPVPTSVGRVEFPRLDIPKGRSGGEFGRGLVQLHQDELLYNASERLGVFPQQVSRAIMQLMAGPTANAQYAPGGRGNTYHSSSLDNRQISNNFNVRSQQSMRLALAQAKAW